MYFDRKAYKNLWITMCAKYEKFIYYFKYVIVMRLKSELYKRQE